MTRPLLAVLAATLVACASTRPPDWFEALLAREAAPMAPAPVASADAFLRARPPAALVGAVISEDEAYRLGLDVGSEASVDCWVYRNELDLASALAELSRVTFESIGEQLGPVEAKRVGRVDTGAFGESPYLAVDWLYRVSQPDGARAGQVKHLVASKDGRSVYCQHNEVGYAQTFRRVVEGLVRTLEFDELDAPVPYYAEIATLSIRGMRIGVQQMTLTRDEDGDTRISQSTSMLLPVDDQTLSASDSFDVQFSRSDGALINQVHVEAENGSLVTRLHLDPMADGHWNVNGTFREKPLDAKIRADAELPSALGEALALRRQLGAQEPAGEFTLERWIPEADPTRLVAQTVVVHGALDDGRYRARVAMEGVDADLVVDPSGSVASGSMEMGFAEVEFERVYVDGTF